jgi:stage II sporulation protein D
MIRRAIPSLAIALVVLTASCTSDPAAGPTGASERGPTGSAAVTGTSGATAATGAAATGATAPEPTGSDATPNSARLRPPDGGSFLVRGTYPRTTSRCVDHDPPSLIARYPGTLAVQRSDDGTLSITVTLTFEAYLEGIAEVPPSWPRQALEAQAIAARSYALATTNWSGAEGETLPTPICATTACQVYRGIPVPFDPTVRRWYRAVRATAGDVLLFEGQPADTVYFSTSNGQTYGNEDVFGSDPLPYLRPVVEEDDGQSPTSHWRVELPYDDVATFLREARAWPRGRAVSTVRLDHATVEVRGGGTTRSMDLSTFRDAVNAWAPCLEPGSYPSQSWRGTQLPTTIPSRWLSMDPGADSVVVSGRGWGHGAGMVQWGAYGKAQRGLSASDILAFYYGGLRPEPYPEPGLIHVQVASGLTTLRIRPSGPGATLDGEELGFGLVTIAGGDELTITTA